ncbi:hypothetical protein HanXRQr2_Chr14g0645961 [Helianthus annuus]|uniref:Uncharacterized protein n=1 Tax=Helianthus annuus TaxID=4232 RepID=A0A9K3EAD4_HELAN|nr:hypothetical protein HanXRQr2_Chr14g0645961 [Helianthus annuus]KAJ0840525.1 hypothetical protein HanPSC8_Chr14g0619831 [Helianthus annuus]
MFSSCQLRINTLVRTLGFPILLVRYLQEIANATNVDEDDAKKRSSVDA